VHCDGCGYAANLERAEIGERGSEPAVDPKPLTPIDTPGASTIEQVTKVLKCKPAKMIKTIIFTADDQPIAVLVRGDHEVNEAKVRRAVGAERLELADPDVIETVTGAPVGFAGPVGLDIPIWADDDVGAMANAVVGGNKADTHLVGTNLGRDFKVTSFADLRNADDQDPCPRCGKVMRLRKAIEVGHVFKLGTKYSEALDARFLDDSEQQHPVIMGCYGIGVNRILAALIETCHDADGIIWPMALAPYEVVISPLNMSDEATADAAEALYEQLRTAGIDVLFDDRNQRPGVKFKDADLIGIPLRVVVGGRGLGSGELECKWRWAAEPEMIKLDGAVDTIVDWVAKEKASPTPLGPLASK
jgi:prolyl-tRNA synthetase